MTKLLSIIIPSYNMERYLDDCCRSLLISHDLLDSLDVLIINDGSTDRTSEIGHKFESDYPGVFTVIDKKNGNYGSCINVGLSRAKGTFVRILDADDTYDTKNFEIFVENIKKFEFSTIDLIFSGCDLVDESGNTVEHCKIPQLPVKVSPISNVLGDIARIMQALRTYRTCRLREIHFHQLEGISYTDTEFAFLPQLNVRDVTSVDCTVYKYLWGRNGQTMEQHRIARDFWMRAEVVLDMILQFEEIAEKRETDQHSVFRKELGYMASAIYRGGIFGVSGQKATVDLIAFDEKLKRLSRAIYDDCLTCHYSNRIPFCYIKHWRNGGIVNSVMVRLCKMYSFLVRKIS